MNPYEVQARFDHAKEAGRQTGCAPLRGKTQRSLRLKQREFYLVLGNICIDPRYGRDKKGNVRRIKA